MSNRAVLVICDGLGLSPEINGNAFVNAATPTFDYILQNYPALSLLAAGPEVGIGQGEPGNSEVGHLTIGTGQVLPQAFQIINGAIKSGDYKTNPVLLDGIKNVVERGSTLHLVGLASKGGVHGYVDHILACLTLANELGVKNVVIHAITDGRDTPPQVALTDLHVIEEVLKQFANGRFGSVGGRYWAMDRDNNWERTDQAVWPMIGKGQVVANSVFDAISQGYARGENDETLMPTMVLDNSGMPAGSIQDGDTVIFTNYRPDRIRQLASRLIALPQILHTITLTDYFFDEMPQVGRPETTLANAYPLPKPSGTLTEILSKAGKRQLHIAETEKYAHITYFFDGHQEKKHPGEEWLLIPSQKVDSFDRVPDMSAPQITQAFLNAQATQPDFTAINYANADMVGHTGNYQATIKAIEALDRELRLIINYAETNNVWVAVTADHGNAEQKINPKSGEIDKEHTTNPVPFLLVHPTLKKSRTTTKQSCAALPQVGMLADVAPTLLEVLGLKPSPEMVGSSLLSQFLQGS